MQAAIDKTAALAMAPLACQRTCARSVAAPRAYKVPNAPRRRSVATMATAAIEKEDYVDAPPASLCRPGIDDNTIRSRFEAMIREGQDSICKAIEEVDGTKFRTDAWTRAAGGGGITRVMQGGNVWEKAGVNVSVVYGTMPAEAYRAAIGHDVKGLDKSDRVPFFACGISSVMHPANPHCPTMHFNYRYFETNEWNGIPGQWWFGGGTDLTPIYVVPEDVKHFHGVYKAVCDRHDEAFYPRFKAWCDEYFEIKHRGERRGLGGIFFDDLNDRDPEALFAFAKDALNHVVEAYVPIIKKHKDDAYTAEQKQWQQIRRGKYAEFNLVYDRGTTFGLKTGGRIESILMSLPLTCSWVYDYEPAEGTPEADFMKAARNPPNWV